MYLARTRSPERSPTVPHHTALLALLALTSSPSVPAGDKGWERDAGRREEAHGFGAAVAVAGDLNKDGVPDLVVGAPCIGTELAGYVDLVSGLTGKRIVRIEGSAAAEEFGYAVAGGLDFDGDAHPDFAIAARAAHAGGAMRGRVVVYSGRTRRPIVELVGEQDHGFFGSALCSPGDLDGNGSNDLVVGAPGQDESRGNAYAFTDKSGDVAFTLRGRRAGDAFGTTLSAVGDWNGDDVVDVAVCALYEDTRVTDCGSLRVYSGATHRPLRTWYGKVGNGWFGCSAANPGDVDGDGVDDLWIGAPGTPRGELPDVGAVHLYSGATGEQLRTVPGEDAGHFFGRRVLSGFDWDRDGTRDWMVTAPYGSDERGRERAGWVSVRSGEGDAELARFAGQDPGRMLGASLDVALETTEDESAWPQVELLAAGAPGRQESLATQRSIEAEQIESEAARPGRVRRLR